MRNYLDEIIRLQKDGQARGIPSICSAHPWVLKVAMQNVARIGQPLLIEATCNQVNQFGGYTGMTPKDFVAYVRGLADANNFPFEKIILGGDHLGPSVWQNEPAESSMREAKTLIRDYIDAGFIKIHLDCSMKLGDDLGETLDPEVSAKRTAQLAKVAENAGAERCSVLRYVIGTEVPIPGGAMEREETVSVTKVEDARQTIEVTREAFCRAELQSAWERVAAVVVQPGVEFGDDFVSPYQPEAAKELSKFIESQRMVYEAHSTDYQPKDALRHLVHDHFAILKVGPALTFAFREAVFALAIIEKEMVVGGQRSNIIQILDDAMMAYPKYWESYYRGPADEQEYRRKYSLSDRIRYYWTRPEVHKALTVLINNLGEKILPDSLLSQCMGETGLSARQVIERKINKVLDNYISSCNALHDG